MYRIFLILALSLAILSHSEIYAQDPKLATFQETAQLLIDQSISNNVTASIALQTTSNQEIRVPTELVKKIHDTEKVVSVAITSEEQCVLGVVGDSCIMINMDISEIEGGIVAIQDTGREIGDSLIGDINEAFDTDAKFHSVYIHHRDATNRALETSGVISGQGVFSAVYTMPREDPLTMYEKFSTILLPPEIRNSGGFYDVAKKLAETQDARITISIIPQGEQTLFQIKLSVDYPKQASEMQNISPLEFFKTEELKRSDYFSQDFYPLNSLLKVVLLSPEPVEVSNVNTKIVPDVIRGGERLPEFTNDGWFFEEDSGEKIDGTYLFGKKFSVNKNELVFSIDSYEGEENGISLETPQIDSMQIVILVGIIMAAAGASIYYLKGFKAKH